jgi:UDP-N-acetylglucosamine:LPS N-acetylglucosamine transferase
VDRRSLRGPKAGVRLKRIVIVSARVGAGHDGAARELARRLQQRGCKVDRYDFLDMLPARLGQLMCDGYHRQLQFAPRSWDWLLAALDRKPLARLARKLSTLAGPKLMTALEPHTDLVVSTYPAAGHTLAGLKRQGLLTAPFVVYLTDPSTHRLCVTSDADVHIAPNHTAAEQARRLGAREVVVAPQAVAPEFRPPSSNAEHNRARETFGLPIGAPLALILAGSWGVGQVEQTTRDVAASGLAHPVVVCGRNESLRRRLTRAGIGDVYGWVDDMPRLMRACDVVVQNAGGLTSSEALASGRPVITYRCLPGHGRANARVLDAAGLVRWVREPDELADALSEALATSANPGTPGLGSSGLDDPALLMERLAAGATELPVPLSLSERAG